MCEEQGHLVIQRKGRTLERGVRGVLETRNRGLELKESGTTGIGVFSFCSVCLLDSVYLRFFFYIFFLLFSFLFFFSRGDLGVFFFLFIKRQGKKTG